MNEVWGPPNGSPYSYEVQNDAEQAHLYTAGGALEICRSDFLIVLIIARWREANAVPVEPVPAAVALQHGPLAVVRQLAQAVQLHRILQVQQRIYQLQL